ncbi:MAG: response regulator transcription factor [Cyclobacteriaceae bacterium]|nr:response regulator transcription factor [Cyclobacteriaceae bacterium]
MIKILIVDDHPLVSDGIATMLRDQGSIQIVGASKTAADALAFLANEEPDIILLDISLPDMNGLELCEKIRVHHKKVKIIGLTSTNEAGIITGLLQRGGNGYLLKNMERSDLLVAIETVMAGRVYLSNAANEKVLEQFQTVKLKTDVPLVTRREVTRLMRKCLNSSKRSS